MFDELKRFEADLRSDPKLLEKLDQILKEAEAMKKPFFFPSVKPWKPWKTSRRS